MNRFVYLRRFFKSSVFRLFLLNLLLLFSLTLSARTRQQDIDSIQNLLNHAKGTERLDQMNRLILLYWPIDSAKSFNYFRKVVEISEHRGFSKQESNAFNYLIDYLNGTAKYNQEILVLKKALKFAEKNNFSRAIGFAYSAIGLQYLKMNNYTKSYEYQKIALQQLTSVGDEYGLSVVYERLGVINMIRNGFIKALKYYYLALSINQKLKLKHETGVSLYHIGLTKLYLADYQEAANYIFKSLKIWDELGEIANQWNSNELLGNIFIKLDDYKKALQYHRKALSIRKEAVNAVNQSGHKTPPVYKLGLAYSYNNIAEVYFDLKQYDSAYYYGLKGLRLKTEKTSIASKNDVANSQVNMGNIYCALKKYDSANIMLSKAAKIYKAVDNKSAYAEAVFGLGNLNLKLKRFEKAKQYFLDGLKAAKEVKDRFDVGKGYEHLSNLYSNMHDYKNALKYHRLYSEKKDSIVNWQNQNKIDELQIEYDVNKKEQQIALQKNIIKQKKNQIFYVVLIGFLLMLIAVIIIVFILYSKKQKEKILQKENENLQKELELKNKDLVCNVSKIYARNKVINHVAHRLINSSEDFKQANRKLIRGVVSELKQNMDETGWKEFDIRFARVYEDFYEKLDSQFPQLTKTERKLCAMLKLGMSSKEIASITMIRSESVDTARSRLRKKLGLSSDEGLFEFLRQL